jgi:hypothetical protein
MTDTIIHIGDVGTIIRLTVTEDDGTTAVNVSTATVKKFYFLKPDGTKVNKTAEFNTDGSDGKLKYTVVALDIDQAGTWQVQAYVEIGAAKYYSTKTTFSVQSNLA